MVKEKRSIFLKSRSFLYSDPVVIGYLSITKRYRPLRLIVLAACENNMIK